MLFRSYLLDYLLKYAAYFFIIFSWSEEAFCHGKSGRRHKYFMCLCTMTLHPLFCPPLVCCTCYQVYVPCLWRRSSRVGLSSPTQEAELMIINIKDSLGRDPHSSSLSVTWSSFHHWSSFNFLEENQNESTGKFFMAF